MAHPRRSRSVHGAYRGVSSTRLHKTDYYWDEADTYGNAIGHPEASVYSPAYASTNKHGRFYTSDPRRSGHVLQQQLPGTDDYERVLPRAPSPPPYKGPSRGRNSQPSRQRQYYKSIPDWQSRSPERGRRRQTDEQSHFSRSTRGTSLHIRITNEDGHDTISFQEVENKPLRREPSSAFVKVEDHGIFDMSHVRGTLSALDASDTEDEWLTRKANRRHSSHMRYPTSRTTSVAPSRFDDAPHNWAPERSDERRRRKSSLHPRSRSRASRKYTVDADETHDDPVTRHGLVNDTVGFADASDDDEWRASQPKLSPSIMRLRSMSQRRRVRAAGQFIELDRSRNSASGFRFPSIDYRRRQIRLVRIIPATSSRYTTCEFIVATVGEPGLDYIALSYTWGNAKTEEDVVPIKLHGQKFWVRLNLWSFLQQARSDPYLYAHWFWIDAMCIDQASTDSTGHQEKNHQVNMMGTIYKNAQEVISWLGEPQPHMASALDHLERFFNGRLAGVSRGKGLSKHDRNKCKQAFQYIASSTYWTRIWVVQEVVKANKVTMRFGRYEIPWQNYWKFESLNILDMEFARLVARWDYYRKNATLELGEIISKFPNQQCSDPRDRIYGLLGLISKRNMPIRADYSKSCEELYEDIIRHLLATGWFIHRRDEYSGCSDERCLFSVDLQEALDLGNIATTVAHARIAQEVGVDWKAFHPFTRKCTFYAEDLPGVIDSW